MSKTKQEAQHPLNVQTVVENLENGYYLTPEFNSAFKNEVKSKIEEFSNWFNSTARLYLLKCDRTESEVYVYLLLSLKKRLKFAISEINKSVGNRPQSYICNTCDEVIEVQPWQSAWNQLQEHPHFEECYSNKIIDKSLITVTEFPEDDESLTNVLVEDLKEEFIQNFLFELEDNDGGINDFKFNSELSYDEEVELNLSEELVQIPLTEVVDKEISQDDDIVDLKFSFEAPYDERVEKTLYPENLVKAAHKADHLFDYTVQRHSVDQGVCLLCPCSIIPMGKISKVTPFVVKNHVYGRKHSRNASVKANVSALKKYHEFWRRQDAMYQAHQLYLIPEISALDRCKCQLCKQSVSYDNIIEHIKTNKLHKTRVFKILKSPKEKLNEFTLFDMQVNMYEDLKNEKKRKKPKKEVSETARRKCVFAKFVIKPNQVNLQPRYRAHSEFFTKNADLVSCRICKISFCNSNTGIRKHILSTQHSQLSGIPLQEYTFFCGICKTHLENEDAWDEHFIKGPNNHDTISQERRLKVAEYECNTCNFVIYGDQSTLHRHISSRRSKDNRTKEVKSQNKDLKQNKKIDYAQILSSVSANLNGNFRNLIQRTREAAENENVKQETQIELAQFSSGHHLPIMDMETFLQNEARLDFKESVFLDLKEALSSDHSPSLDMDTFLQNEARLAFKESVFLDLKEALSSDGHSPSMDMETFLQNEARLDFYDSVCFDLKQAFEDFV